MINEQHLIDLQTQIDNSITPAHQMQIQIVSYNAGKLILKAPLSCNINHHGTGFAGSLYSLGAVSGWGLLQIKLLENNIKGVVVVRAASIDYLVPATTDFYISTELTEPASLTDAMAHLKSTQSARFEVSGKIMLKNGDIAAVFKGSYTIKQ